MRRLRILAPLALLAGTRPRKLKAAEERRNAAKDCAEERAAGRAAFAEKYGKNPNKRNAFGKCESAEARS